MVFVAIDERFPLHVAASPPCHITPNRFGLRAATPRLSSAISTCAMAGTARSSADASHHVQLNIWIKLIHNVQRLIDGFSKWLSSQPVSAIQSSQALAMRRWSSGCAAAPVSTAGKSDKTHDDADGVQEAQALRFSWRSGHFPGLFMPSCQLQLPVRPGKA